MKKIILTKGLPASGKTTWALKMLEAHPGQYKRVNKDDLRAMIDNGKWSKKNEEFILVMRDFLITQALLSGYSVIVDDTNLALKHAVRMMQIATNWNEEMLTPGKKEIVSVEIKEFTDVTPEECIERDLKRANSVGSKVIWKMYNQFLKPEKAPIEKIEYNPALPDAIVCDLDGTLALFGTANPYDRDFLKDKINVAIANILSTQQTANFEGLNEKRIIILSGRIDKYTPETQKWLRANNIIYDALFMRKTGDTRKDAIVKREIYEAQIKGKCNVIFILDDRDQVVEMWRSLGLTCLQVAPGNF